MPVTRDMLLEELRGLQRLTAFEQTIATVRRTQAASGAVATELAANAAQSGERLALLGQAMRGVGGSPDLVGPMLGKLSALLQTQVNQVQTLQGALLGDLALEHRLRDRTRYARTLAVTLGEVSVLPVLDRLDRAHTETIAWLETRLGEVGRTGSSAIHATPVQQAVGGVRRVAALPFSLAAAGVNSVAGLAGRFGRSAAPVVEQAAQTVQAAGDAASGLAHDAQQTVQQTAQQVQETASQATEQAEQAVGAAGGVAEQAVRAAGAARGDSRAAAGQVADDARATAVAAVNAAEERAADAAGAVQAATERMQADTAAATASPAAPAAEVVTEAASPAQVTHEVLEATGGDDVEAVKPPFAAYERLTGDSVMRHVDDTEDVEELRVLLAFEQAHKARKGVLTAAQRRLRELAGTS